MSLELPTQSVLLYKGKWTIRIDDLLISTTLRFKCDHPWPGTDIPNTLVNAACAAVEKELGVKFTQLEISYRYLFLEQRYLIFEQVVAWAGTTWVPSVKIVVATDCLWKDIFKVHPFATTYYHRDELEFFRLGVIFGWDAGKVEATHDIIVISDSVDDVQQPNMVNEPLTDCDGEVNLSVRREKSTSS
ncbi:hypothetical protein SASPL_148536 [Salvia splendens]|uniref:Uncharacterized protein n=1 Tax=Salvia splendens TaxID=180675 RepID=A0A8X8Z3T0_SALSN|nr:hypothetical protein SASPL_148536 [Salvia splendens]